MATPADRSNMLALDEGRGGRSDSASIHMAVSCLACKARKSKCTRVGLCEECRRRGTECIYDIASDRRRKIASARKDYDIQWYRRLSSGIIALIQAPGDHTASRHLTNLQKIPSVLELANYVDDVLQTEPAISKTGLEILDEFDRLDKGKPIFPDSASLWSPNQQVGFAHLPITMASRPWTILADDEMISHLLSLFFTWQQPSFQYIDKTAFLKDMSSATTLEPKKKFCSPLLVNAILAQACMISPRRSECQPLHSSFYLEAKKLLELEWGRASLTTMQALLVMQSLECDAGRDRIGRIYRHQAVDMYKRLGYERALDRPPGCDQSKEIQQEWRATTRVIWATFCFEGLNAHVYGFESSIKPPAVEQYFLLADDGIEQGLDGHDGGWTPYPMSNSSSPALLTPILKAQCMLAEIFWNILIIVQSQNEARTPSKAAAMLVVQHQRLVEWKQDLDPRLQPDRSNVGHVYHLDIWYHISAVFLLRHAMLCSDVHEIGGLDSPEARLEKHCHATMESVWRFRSAFSFQYNLGAGLLGPLIISYALIGHLDGRGVAQSSFSRAVQALREHGHLTVVPFLLAGLKTLAQLYAVQLSLDVQGFLKTLDRTPQDFSDVPMEMPIMIWDEIGIGVPSDQSRQLGRYHVESMSQLLKKGTQCQLADTSPVL